MLIEDSIVEDLRVKNFTTYKKYLLSLVGENCLPILINALGGEEKIMNASFGMNINSGLAYNGAMVQQSLKIGEIAAGINDLLPKEKRVEPSKIWKVALLSHISKVVMYAENFNKWEVENRGIKYTFVEKPVVLKGGELSALIAMNSGIKFTEEEYEAMRILDKIKEDDSSSRWGSCTLSMLIRQANEIITNINRK